MRLINRNLHPVCEIAGTRRIRFHDLRHSCAMLMLEQGVKLVTIKEPLGRAQIHTADAHSRVPLPLQLDALEAVGCALGESSMPY